MRVAHPTGKRIVSIEQIGNEGVDLVGFEMGESGHHP